MNKFRLLRAEEIDCRINTVGSWGVTILLYKDARCDMNILDETVGPENWQRKHEVVNGNLFCNVGIYVSRGEWVWKQDVGVESYTEKEKGEASDSFKRACTNWGIGRELYTAPSMMVYAKDLKTLKQDDRGKWTCKDYFVVDEIDYTGRTIGYVRIRNVKTGSSIEFGTPKDVKAVQDTVARKTISATKARALQELLEERNVNIDKLKIQYGVTALNELTEEQHCNIIQKLQAKK